MDWKRAIAMPASGLQMPFGYTLTMWGSGAASIDRYGHLSAGIVLLFVAGGVLGYLTLALLAFEEIPAVMPLRAWRGSVLNGTPLIAVGIVLAVVHVIGRAEPGFFLAGYLGTASYVILFGLVLRLAGARPADTARR